MFQELDGITLLAPIPAEQTWDIPEGSPLLAPADGGPELLPGDVGTIVCVQGGGAAFDVEFVEPNGYTVALATVYPHQLRLAVAADYRKARFGRTALSQRPAAWRGGDAFAEYTNIVLTEPIPDSEMRRIPEDSPLHPAANPEGGLDPGAIGFIASIDHSGTAEEVLLVDFMDADGRLMAAAKIRPSQCRPATPADRANYYRPAPAATAG